MIRLFGGGGGGGGYPGVTSPSSGSLSVPGSLLAGDSNAVAVPSFFHAYGVVTVADSPGTLEDGDTLFSVTQNQPLLGSSGGYEVALIYRGGNIAVKDYAAPAVHIQDDTASAQPVVKVEKQGVALLQLGIKPAITGALSSVADANARAVLASVIAALTGVSVATNSTT